LTRLVQQIIELSRLQGDAPLEAPRPVHLPEVIAQAVDASSIDAGAKQISVHTECPPDLELLGSSEQITLALSNLVSNAVTYSPEGSTVL
ncbi:hypothetical protein ACI3GN_15465, partial [Lactiplantibacillus plantarum]